MRWQRTFNNHISATVLPGENPSIDDIAKSVIADGMLLLTEDGEVPDGIVIKEKRSRQEVRRCFVLSFINVKF